MHVALSRSLYLFQHIIFSIAEKYTLYTFKPHQGIIYFELFILLILSGRDCLGIILGGIFRNKQRENLGDL